MIDERGSNDHLKFRRQFLISQDICQELSHWQHKTFEKFQVYAHQDIELTTISLDNVELALIGFMIDPYHPNQSNAEVLHCIGNKVRTIGDVPECLHALSGRFVLLVNIAQEIYVFHDPCGLRSVFYANHDNKIYLGSQPSILEYVIPLEKGDKFDEFNRSSYKASDLEYWLPSNYTVYENIQRLVPNHYLQLTDLKQVRYWPNQKLQVSSLEKGAQEASEILVRLLVAGNNRFDLALPVTAGWDSRMLLASCKEIVQHIYFYTLQYRNLTLKSSDILIPNKILKSLNQAHHVIDCNKNVDRSFSQQYFENVSLAHEDWSKIAHGLFLEYPQDKVCIKGNCAEISRSVYDPKGQLAPIHSAEQVIKLEPGWEDLTFVKKQFTHWFDESIKVANETGIYILDLFYWEHKMGSWQAQSQLEWDIAQEVFSPFNHRELIETMLSVPSKYRQKGKRNVLCRKMIKNLWPEILEQPINPQKSKNWKYYYRKTLKRLRL